MEVEVEEGVKGSWESSGKLVFGREVVGVRKVMDLMKVTWQVSGYKTVSMILFSFQIVSRGSITHLHPIKHLPIKIRPPPPRLPRIPKLHKHQIPIHPPRHHHPKMAHHLPRLLPHKPQEITRRKVPRYSRYTQRRALLLSLPLSRVPHLQPKPSRLLPIPI